jgi:NhaA family Na+:H+ antiporter
VRQQSPPRSPLRRAHSLTRRFRTSVARFLHVEAAGGVVLLAAAALALLWANSPWSASYASLWHAPITLSAAGAVFARPLEFWVNEGLMTLFFFVVGLEIRGEIAEGALSTMRAALLPVIAALGGMAAPALVFLAISHSPALWHGWAVPTATDIAFAVGILALLGRRVPRPLRAFLLALAIIDDIGAIVIIAFFYSRGMSLPGLALAAAAAGTVLAFERWGLRSRPGYVAAGIVIWVGLLWGGIHPTLAGVILGFLIPATPAVGRSPQSPSLCRRFERALHPWVAYGVMPVFALANAGIPFRGMPLDALELRKLVAGVAVALLLGKPLGIVLATLAASRLRLGELPRGMDRRGVLLVGCLGGIGFTMSIFIAGLAFTDAALLAAAKLGILIGSAAAALLGLAVGLLTRRRHPAA